MTDIDKALEQAAGEPKVSSKRFALNAQDFLRGLFMAVGGAVVTIVQTSLEAGNLHFNWKQIGIVAGSAACVYLAKNFFQKPVIQIPITPEQVDQSTLDKTAK